MTTVVLGTNRFIGCESIFALGDKPILRVDAGPEVTITFHTPEKSERPVHVVRGVLDAIERSDPLVRVVKSATACAVFWGDALIVNAVALDAETVHVKLDLRPIGMSIFDDGEGLHVGPHHMAGSMIGGSRVGIALG